MSKTQLTRSKVSVVATFNGYYDFSAGVTCFQITDTVKELAQAVAPIDDRRYLSELQELVHEVRSSLLGFARTMTCLWLTNHDNTSP